MKSVFKATLIVMIFSVVTRGISFIYRIYLSRMIGSEGMGLYQIVLSLFSVFITVTSSGIPVAVSKQTAAHEITKNTKAEFGTVTAALIVGLTFSVAISAIFFLLKDQLAFVFADPRCMPIFVLLLPAIITSSMYSAFRGGLWGKRKYVSYSLTEFVEEVAMVVGGIILLQGIVTIADGAKNAALAVTISYFGGCLLTILLYFLKGGKLSSPKGYFKPMMKSALPITGIRIITTIMQTVIAFLLPTFLARYSSVSQAISDYGTMIGMTFPMLFLPSTVIGSLALVLVPELSMLQAGGNKAALKSGIEKAYSFSLYICFLIVPIYIALGEDICRIIYNNAQAGKYLQYAAILILPIGMTQVCTTMLNSLGMEIKTFVNSLIGSAFLLLCVVLLPRFIGIYALVLGHTLSLTITFILNTVKLKNLLPISMRFIREFLLMLLISVPTVILGILLSNLLKLFLPLFVCTAITSAVMLAGFILLTQVFKVIDVNIILTAVKKRKKVKKIVEKF